MVLNKLSISPRVGEKVYDAIFQAIINGDYRAGRHLQIRRLADELGTSVMPVREAITRLEQIGLVESLPYRGAVVKSFSASELIQVYRVRLLLETEAARAGVEGFDEKRVQELEALFTEMELAIAEREYIAYLDADEKFLRLLYTASGNRVLVEMIEALWVRCRHFKLVGVKEELESDNANALLTHQQNMLVRLKAQDSEGVARACAKSIDDAIARVEKRLRVE